MEENPELFEPHKHQDAATQGFNMSSSMVEGNSTTIILSNQTYNNSVQTTNLTATFASQSSSESSAYWSSDVGLDTYLTSSVTAALPSLSANSTADSATRQLSLQLLDPS